MKAVTLLPDPTLLRLDHADADGGTITLVVTTSRPSVPCPSCAHLAQRVHSRYVRKVMDLPWQGIAVRLRLQSRRFFCDNQECKRRVFTERLPGVVERYARKTIRLDEVLLLIGYLAGGETGARIAAGAGMQISPDALLCSVRRRSSHLPHLLIQPSSGVSSPEHPPVRILGVDDWAFRRGHRYGTILVDLERKAVVDLLPDRTADGLAAWLKANPTVEVVSRDRGGAYADGIRQGAPAARQVADRFHLLKNLVEVLERSLVRHYHVLREVAKSTAHDERERRVTERNATEPTTAESASPSQAPPAAVDEPSVDTPHATRPEREKLAARARRMARYNQVMELHRQGATIRAIADHFRMNRRTVRLFVRAGAFPERAYPQRRNQLDPYEALLREHWEAGCHCAAALYRELKARGYAGCESSLRAYLRRWRAEMPPELARDRRRRRGHSPPAPSLSPRRAAWLLVKGPMSKDPAKRAIDNTMVERLVTTCPEAREGRDLARAFFQLVSTCEADGPNTPDKEDGLEEWITAARSASLPEFRAFAGGIVADRDAVIAAMTSPWSNGQVEGQVNRLKFIERSMYGRAKFDLLRARVLPIQ